MSVRQGSNILAGGVVCDNTPTSGSQNAVSSGGVYTALAGKVSTGHEVIDFQEPTAENNYTWYRKYADGWVEQGGKGTAVGASGITIVLPVEMSDAHYSIQGTCDGNSDGGKFHTVIWSSQTATGFMITPARDGVFAPGVLYWQVSGMAA